MTFMINGREPADLIKLLHNDEAVKAQRARNLYTGEQHEETCKFLSHPQYGIANWRTRGFTPFTRNITAQIIDKSGLVFGDGLPAIALKDATGEVNLDATAALMELLDGYEFTETLQSLDVTLRLLQSVMLLVSICVEEDGTPELDFDILHAGNSYAIYNDSLGVDTLIRITGSKRYEVMTSEKIYQLEERGFSQFVVTSEQDNTFGFIPVCMFHDKNAPIYGKMHKVDETLSMFNLLLNKALTNLSFSVDWANNATLFSSVRLPDDFVGGPGTLVEYESAPGETPKIEYIAPKVDITGINEVLNSWTRMVASAYSVRVEEDSSASSGFQLVVKENANLQLRKERQRQMEAGFARMWLVIQKLALFAGKDFTQFTLSMDFPAPSLPINEAEVEDVWEKRIASGRATIKDYLIQVTKLTPEEADQKLLEIRAERALMTAQ